jgi:uncharacterized membrane protein YphA (DoxX/SURF4 family)
MSTEVVHRNWTFLWPFLDKTFGLTHQTPVAKAWIHGGSPTQGFLSGASGPFGSIYQSFAGASWANWGFMIGLLAIAVALLLGIGTRVAAASGAVMLVLMWSASLPPSDDIFMDNHLIYALVLIGLAIVGAGNTSGSAAGGRRPAWSAASPGSPEAQDQPTHHSAPRRGVPRGAPPALCQAGRRGL